MKRLGLFMAGMLLAVAPVRAGIWLPAIFNDSMVLQAEKPLHIWGKAIVGESVLVEIIGDNGAVVSTADSVVAGDDQKWSVELPAVAAGLTVSLRITGSQSGERILTDILTGEVWLCSGQSNMKWEVQKANDGAAEVTAADYPEIRLFTAELTAASVPLGNCAGAWAVCSSNTVAEFSATAYYFGRELHQQLGRPVGLIMCAVGGTPVSAWTPLDPQLADSDTAELWDIFQENISNTTVYGTKLEKGPARLYNGMIYPYSPVTLRGVAWYQGEQNSNEENNYFGGPTLYRKLFPMMITAWRETWAEPDLPFLYVELANYKTAQTEPVEEEPISWGNIREAQASALVLSNVYAVSAIDIGEADNIHYGDKQTAGRRLALAAFGNVYGTSNAPTLSPWYIGHTVENDRIRVRLSNADGLTTDDGLAPAALAICGTNAVWYWAESEIDGDDLLVWNDSVPEPVAVRHAWADNPDVNVYNSAGLPLRPFRTDLESLETYVEWAARHFTSEQYADVAVSGQNADASGDGEINLLKYAQGIGPFEDSCIFAGRVTGADGRPGFTCSRKVGAGDQGFAVETTDSLLGEWGQSGFDEAAVETQVSSGGCPARQRFTIMPPQAMPDTWFARVAMDVVPEIRNQASFGPDGLMSIASWSWVAQTNTRITSISQTLSNTTAGNPGDELKLNLTYTADGTPNAANIRWFLADGSWTYDPSVSGAIASISGSVDVRATTGALVFIGLKQNGTVFWSSSLSSNLVATTDYQTFSEAGLTEADFTATIGIGTLDLSAAGSEITAGFVTRRGEGGDGSRNWDFYYDNASISIEITP
jgi:sialate O-acetylesterase